MRSIGRTLLLCLFASPFTCSFSWAAKCVLPTTSAPHATAVIYNPHYPHSRSTSHGHVAPLLIDDHYVCKVSPGHYVIAYLTPGVHTIRSNDKNFGVKLDFTAGSVHFYKTSYDDDGLTVKTFLQPEPPEELAYDLQMMKPEKGETKPLPGGASSAAPAPSE